MVTPNFQRSKSNLLLTPGAGIRDISIAWSALRNRRSLAGEADLPQVGQPSTDELGPEPLHGPERVGCFVQCRQHQSKHHSDCLYLPRWKICTGGG